MIEVIKEIREKEIEQGKEKRNVPQLRFKGFEDEWEEKKLGSLLKFKNGINADKDAYGKGVKFINVLDILNNNYITADKIIGKVSIDSDILSKYIVNYGDVLFQRSSETREEVGTANVYLDKESVTFGGFVIRGEKIGEYEPFFMNNLLKSSSARKEITTKAGGSTRYNVSQEILSEVLVKFPSLEEQKKIADFFTLMDKKIEKQSEKVEALKIYKKGMMQKIFKQEIRFKDENGEEFSEWEEKRLGNVVNFYDNLRRPIKEGERTKGIYPYYGATGIIDYIDDYIFEGQYLLLGEDGANIVTRSLPLIYITEGKFWLNNHSHIFSPKENLNIYYLKQYLETINYIPFNTGTAQPKLNIENVKKIPVNVPILKEQKKIANLLNILDKKIEKEEEKLEELRIWKKGLLQKMFV